MFKRGGSPSSKNYFPLARGRVHPEGFSLKGIKVEDSSRDRVKI
jgi:hypothetical protein